MLKHITNIILNCEYLLFGNTYAAIVHVLKYMLKACGGRAKLLTNQLKVSSSAIIVWCLITMPDHICTAHNIIAVFSYNISYATAPYRFIPGGL